MSKPGIVRGNVLTVIAGFLLASRGHIDWMSLVAVVSGTALVIASACVINNYIDRNIDKKMERTKKRALVTGSISLKAALVYASVLGIAGFIILAAFTNFVALAAGIVAYIFYVFLYGLAKRKSYHGTLVGTVPGALPIVAGYVAVTGVFDLGALILFIIMVLWQMPHFYAIAIYRKADYSAAGIPVISIVKGIPATKRAILWYILAFAVAASCLAVAGYAGVIYLFVMIAMSLLWFVFGYRGITSKNDMKWAKNMFRFSLLVTLVFSVLISVDNLWF